MYATGDSVLYCSPSGKVKGRGIVAEPAYAENGALRVYEADRLWHVPTSWIKEPASMTKPMSEEQELGIDMVVGVIDGLSKAAYQNSASKGFHDYVPESDEAKLANEAMKIALMHSELSEALEGLRHGNLPDDKLPEFSSVEIEMADTLIRIFDYAGFKKLRLGDAIVAKMAYNATRPPKHGKKF